MRKMFTVLTVSLLVSPLCAQQQGQQLTLDSLQYLIGDWVGEGSGKPGEGSGHFSFAYDLQAKILVRKNHSEYPATKDRPAFVHDDLLFVYPEGTGKLRGIYFDNEGHVIHYDVTRSQDRTALVLVSDPSPSAPRFRLTYVTHPGEPMRISFETAPPGKPDAFALYLEGKAHRK